LSKRYKKIEKNLFSAFCTKSFVDFDEEKTGLPLRNLTKGSDLGLFSLRKPRFELSLKIYVVKQMLFV